MKSQIEFNVEGIEYIQFSPVKELDFIYNFHIPAKSGFKYLFHYKREFRNVWTHKGHTPYYSDYYGSWEGAYTTKSLKEKGYFQKEESATGPWFEKASVTVQTCKHQHTAYFKTDKEAMSWIQSVKDLSGATFKVIMH